MNRIQELTLKLLDDALTDGERDELEWLLTEDPAARGEHFALMELEGVLRGERTADVSAEVMRRITKISGSAIQRGVMAKIQAQGRPAWRKPSAESARTSGARPAAKSAPNLPRVTLRSVRRSRMAPSPALWMGLAAAVALVILGVLVLPGKPTRTGEGGIATLENVSDAIVVRRAGARETVKDGARLQSGDGLEISPGGAAIAVINDGTRVLLEQESRATISQDKSGTQIRLAAGTLRAKVPPQKGGAAFRVATPEALSTVLGTRFTVTAKGSQTRLEVDEGRVQFVRSSDSKSVIITAGEFAIAGAGVEFAASALQPAVPAAVERGSEGTPRKTAYGVTHFTLINADTGRPVPGYTVITTDTELRLSKLPRNLTLTASTHPEIVGSVVFDINGVKRIEDSAPYAITTNWDRDKYVRWNVSPGTHAIQATPYRQQRGMGAAGEALSVTLRVSAE